MIKKLMMMAVVGSLALGADASYTGYKYELSLHVVPVEVLDKVSSITCYLVDKSITDSKSEYNDNALMAKFEYKNSAGSPGYIANDSNASVSYYATTYDVTGDQTRYADNLAAKSDVTQGKQGNDLIKMLTFTTGDTDIQWNDLGAGVDIEDPDYKNKYQAAVDSYADQNLEAILVAKTLEGKELKFYLDVTANGANKSLGSSEQYSQVVPEPTSGVLFLLGLAGLMLKRKRAA